MVDKEKIRNYNEQRRTARKNVACHAAFTSMNFHQSGAVKVCCYNGFKSIGKYPDDTLKGIWFGEKAENLRQEFKNTPFPAGCELCVEQFEAQNYSGILAKNYDSLVERDFFAAFRTRVDWPKSMEFEISNTCNLECVMCNGTFSSSIRKNVEKLPPLRSPYDDEFLVQLKPFLPKLKKAKFLGGEPFLIPTYQKIWQELIKCNSEVEVIITTNATQWNSKVESTIKSLPCTHIVLSIDSLEKETFESIRRKASFEEVQSNISNFLSLKENGFIDGMSMAICPMRQNWKEIPLMLDYCNKNDIYICFNTVVSPYEFSLKHLFPSRLEEILLIYNKKLLSFSPSNNLLKANQNAFFGLINQLEDWKQLHLNDLGTEDSFVWKLLSDLEPLMKANGKTKDSTIAIYANDLICAFKNLKKPDNFESWNFSGSQKINAKIKGDLYALDSKELNNDYSKCFFGAYKWLLELFKLNNIALDYDKCLNGLTILESVLNSHSAKYQFYSDLINTHPAQLLRLMNSYTEENIKEQVTFTYGGLV